MNIEFIKKIVAPQVKFEAGDELDKFARFFCDLYRIEIYKDGLDLILTKLRQKDLSFEIKIVKGWDTNQACYLTEQSRVFNKILGKFSKQISKKIILRNFVTNVMAHEMAHALEFESGLDLGEEFRQCIGYDMKDREVESLPLRAEIKRLMVDALKAYPQYQFISELFARYFELLSLSRGVRASGDFTQAQITDFFANTTNFVTKIFNPQIRSMIDEDIAKFTSGLLDEIRLTKPEKKFQDSVRSTHQNPEALGGRVWAKSVSSNSKYQIGWQKYQELEDKKNN